ncbi:MAG TPA: tol-pal system protein YbgF [Desulfuromonadales bacterium]|nr:tol-pal system protein YbgF [Desulfuromonadales bacterium]
MKLLYVIAALSLAYLSGCASQGSMDSVRTDIDAIKTRIYSLDKDVGGLREESKTSVSAVEKGFKTDVASVRKMSADIQSSIDSARGDMQLLNGKQDDLALALKTTAEDLARYRTDADKRIFALEDRILKQQAVLDDLNKRLVEVTKSKKDDTPTAPDASYSKGLETYRAGDMPAARELFLKFIDQHPQHDLVANAHYWIGETYYNEKNYEPAILSYQEVIKNFPGKEKVMAAMLKQAMAFNAINDGKSAKYVLKKLLENYPKSDEAKRGRTLLKEIK